MDFQFIEEALVKQEPVKIQVNSGEIFSGWLVYSYNSSFIQLDTGFGCIAIAKESIKYFSYVYK
ncbi:hypothetical protein R70723_16695 [Paenibacillus sp. FSL R7-0273]|uniref:hypothetical protein n=1 Tax=Paenibacillus sp. FSL R7-0273 TaxID=1536772 RepID=UPI0004F762A3|nr:hypothetical protein [Paenibacillus sp. FSL R7-0273]AIQ47344.1 hypothetical protein R70723_16695 [Paenibacillus sp. FSL R7-0273]OMF96103.1 hypothetical protein BK144_05885 [Paenibacillus sp. FSL R7-0273]